MDKNILRLIDESIKLERNIASLYMLFYGAFPEDLNFWWQLTLEESNHAALLESGRDYFIPADGLFPCQIISTNLESLTEINSEVEILLKEYKQLTPSRELAFNLALRLEGSAGELHFQQTVTEEKSNSEILELFKKLNKEDKDHALRIRKYMHDENIKIS